MYKEKLVDKSNLRKYALKEKKPIIEILFSKLGHLSKKNNTSYTLLAVCPNSENVLKAALRSAKRSNAPIKFAATLNQVDIDGGYTGWTQHDLVKKIKEESYKIGYNGPIIIAVDHGGPWLKDIQRIEKWSLNKALSWIKKSFEEALLAGYDLIHIDPTVDIFNKDIKIEVVVDRTIELVSHTEKFRKLKKLKPISYEVGTEEVHGGLADMELFNKFLSLLKIKLKKTKLEYLWPIFIVAKVGTDLHTTRFDSSTAKEVVKIVSRYGSYIKGHYTDFVENPEDYPKSGIGAANVGPEFTMVEYNAFQELIGLEKRLFKGKKNTNLSRFKETLTNAVINSGRWEKWLLCDEKNFDSLSEERKDWILQTSCRYIWTNPDVNHAKLKLYNNLELNGIDAEDWILMKIESSIDKYYRAFNLININEKIDNIL
ncbi:MAG: class II D-tagatose-bisphosphate aldolase, non-catalytic subunit [Actinomycetia bacterium]|nr:class II D-tagatose-bisphosphate aldolase, non-catalytic subunit [Actinomycetes bacterium]